VKLVTNKNITAVSNMSNYKHFLGGDMQREPFTVKGMHCASCAQNIETNLKKITWNKFCKH